jgi:hypothetical protein
MEINKKELEEFILDKNMPYSAIGKLYGITGNAIKKKAKYLGISLPKRRVINSNEIFSHSGFKKTSLVNMPSDDEFIIIINNNDTWEKIGKLLGYQNLISSNVKDSIQNRCSKLGIELKINSDNSILLNKTKGELFANRKNWQSARNSIQKNARRIYFENVNNPKCIVCGYNKHVEVAHIKPVSDFNNNTTIREINSLSNLIGLCPNHHWEYDNGVITI